MRLVFSALLWTGLGGCNPAAAPAPETKERPGESSSDTATDTADEPQTDTPSDTADEPQTDTGDSGVDPHEDTGTIDDEPVELPDCSTLNWPDHVSVSATTDLAIEYAKSEPWTVSLPPETDQGPLIIGVWPEDTVAGEQACYQLDSVVADGETWVHEPTDPLDRGLACLTCPERVAVRQGSGWFVFPRAPATVRELILTVGIRDCKTGAPALAELGDPIPESLSVMVGRSGVEAEAPTRLPIHLVLATDFDLSELAEQAVTEAATLFADAGFILDIDRTSHLPPSELEPTFEGAHRGGLSDILTTIEAHDIGTSTQPSTIPVVLVDCLEQTGMHAGLPEGFSTAIPGRVSEHCALDAVFVRVAQCVGPEPFEYPWTASSMGKVMAHEIGHFMGLYHSVESDGTEDNLDDTDENNLMYFQTLSSTAVSLSASQIERMQAHTLLFGPSLPAK